MDMNLIQTFRNTPAFTALFHRLMREKNIRAESHVISFIALLSRALSESGLFPVLLADPERDLEKMLEACMSFFPDDTVAWLPFFDYGTELYNHARFENHFARYASLLTQDKLSCVIASSELLSHPVQNPAAPAVSSLSLAEGQSLSFEWLTRRLSDMGYARTELVEHPGEFCIRGGIVDVYPYGSPLPQRMEFFGNTLESIRSFNPDSQLSVNDEKHLRLFPSSGSLSPRSPFITQLPEKTVLIYLSGHSVPHDKAFLSITFSPISDEESFNVLPLPPFRAEASRDTHIIRFVQDLKTVCLFWQSSLLKDRLVNLLHDYHNVHFVRGSLPDAFLLKDLRAAFLNDTYFFQKEHLFNPDAPFIPDVERVPRRDVLKYGEAVVHVDYGIGIYLGTRFSGGDEELILEYDQEDRVYLPVRHIDKIYRFSEGHARPPRPDSLKRKTWEPKKQRAKKSAAGLTDELLKLYRKRVSKQGLTMDGDPASEKELALTFPWPETRDQDLAIKTVKEDMGKPLIMDRLICGDVGFGKTEVAIRAAFRAVLSGFQVAVLVPTTILSIQHFETFKERLSPLGVSVDILNRFRTEREFKTIRESVVQGRTDILIGTHRILSNNLFFKNLGLLIIDEEHRFGVRHKEKIQSMRSNVDVLALSATPIPRTLQLSLSGIRDILRIDTPPKERIPIYTKVIHWDSNLIRQVLRDELKRGGQILVVENNIRDLEPLTHNLEMLVPEARIRFAHGQLTGKILENHLIDFFHHQYDILVSTTIIESGIDIPNANTLIVMNAHRFGLSQLYQIRGRVGRSFRKAYAYLVIPRHKHISPDAMQRLKALEFYTDLGSGYHIALRDLELRGAGNLFGTEQSGHIDQVGYRYFLKLLTDEIELRTRRQSALQIQPDISLSLRAFLPASYIPPGAIRLELYQSLAATENAEDVQALRRELTDRFGPPPPEALNLLQLRHLYLLARGLGIESITRLSQYTSLVFNPHIPHETLQKIALTMIPILKDLKIPHTFHTKGNFSVRIRLDKGKEPEILKMLLESVTNKNKFDF
ncbi:MAG: Transcription-repair coupling factor [Marinimicrobia bacterium 46_47]|nr:MAG: Transcription-repair coupling factor [Marinimicrobia bacterium 46_47]